VGEIHILMRENHYLVPSLRDAGIVSFASARELPFGDYLASRVDRRRGQKGLPEHPLIVDSYDQGPLTDPCGP
jgi:hypothetical protein